MEPADDGLDQGTESQQVSGPSSNASTTPAPSLVRPIDIMVNQARPQVDPQPRPQPQPTPVVSSPGLDPNTLKHVSRGGSFLFHFNKKVLMLTVAVFLTVSLAIVGGLLALTGNNSPTKQSSGFAVKNLSVAGLSESSLRVSQNDQLAINGELKLNKGLILAPGDLPANPQTGQIYLNSGDNKIYYFNGTTFVSLASSDSLALLSGAGIAVSGQTISNTGVTSLQGTPGQITVSQASGAVTLGLPSLPTGQLLLGGGSGALGSLANGANGDCLLANGGGSAPSFQTCPSGSAGITGSGTAGTLAKFISGGVIGDSVISEAGSTVTIAGSLTVNSAVSGSSFSGNGSGLTSINGSNISSGTVADARLSGNVALLNASQTFTGANIFRSSSNSATALQVQTSAAATVFDVDTINSRVGIGTTGPGYSLDVQGGDVNTSGIYRVNGAQISSANLSNDANLAKLNAANVFSASNTFSTNVTIQGTSSLTLGTASNVGSVIFRDGASANSASLRLAGALGASATFQLPVAAGTQNICTVELGNCAGSGSGITGTGTVNKIAKFSAAQNLIDSSITDDGTTVTVAVGQIIQGSAGLTIGASGVNGQLVFKNSSNSNTLTLQAGATTSSFALTLPTGDGGNGNCLKTNGSGVLAFAACTGGAGGGVTSVNTLTGVVNIVGTANQINVGTAGDTITLSLPQDITTAGNVSFRTITLNGTAAGDNLIVGNAITGATGNLLDLKVNNVSKLTVDASGNVNTVGQFQVNGSQISSANLSNDANLAKLNGTGPQTFTGNNKFSGTFLAQNASNSVTSFQIQNAAGTSNLFNADTTNSRIGIGTAAPGYALDVNGDINTSGVYRINGVTVCSGTSCTAASGSGNYIQNGTSAQTNANFNIVSASTSSSTAVIQGAASQTQAVTIIRNGSSPGPFADLLELQDSGGAVLTSFDLNGNLTVGVSSVRTISSPGSNASSEHFGAGSALNDAASSIAIGNSTLVAGGTFAASAIGYAAQTGATGATAIGTLSQANGTNSIALGRLTTATIGNSGSIAIGYNLSTTASNQLVVGSSDNTYAIQNVFIGNGVTNASPLGFTLQATGGSGTNIAGAGITIAGGQGTGNATGGNIIFQYSAPGASGSTLRSLQTACFISASDGTLSCPGSGSSSERFGSGATATGGGATAFGRNARSSNTSSLAVGAAANASGSLSIAVGTSAAAAGSNAIAIGANSSAGFDNSIAIGQAATTAATGQLVFGDRTLTNAFFGGISSSVPANFTLQASGGSGTNIAGASVTLAGGKGTGTGVGGNIVFQYAPAGSTGSTANALQTACTISGTNGSLSCTGVGASSERFGAGSLAAGLNSAALGGGASSGGANSLAAGPGASSSGSGGTAIGAATTAGGVSSIVIGKTSTANYDYSIAIGSAATTTATNQLVIGANNAAIQNAFIGNGVINAAPIGFTLQATGGSGTNIAGASVTLAGGIGTGTGNGGNLNFQIAKPGSTGSTANTLATVASLSGVNGAALFKNSADSTTAFQVQNSSGTSLFTADTTNTKLTVAADIVANSSATATTGTTTGTGTNTTTLTLTTDAFSVNDVVFIDNAGQDYYTRITVDPGTGSYTVDPAITFETTRTVTKYTIQNIGATTTDYTTQANRFFEGKFLGQVTVGAGTTKLSDGQLLFQGDTNLYRSAASTLKTDGTLNVASGYQINGTAGTSTTCSGGQMLQNQVVSGGLVTGGSCASASGSTLQQAYAAGNSISTTDARDINFSLADTATDSNFVINVATGSTSKISVQSNSVETLSIDKSGNVNTSGGVTAATFSGNGASITALNGSNISTGTVADARLTTNVTLQGNTFNGVSQLVQTTAGGILPVLSGANLTNLTGANVTGNIAGNAGTATALAANPTDCAANTYATTIAASGNLTCASITDAALTTNVTLQGNTFNGNSQLVQLTSLGKLPVLDGSNLTTLNGTNIATGTVANARLTTNVTLQGNTFNGITQLVQTTAGGILPVLSGANLTALNGSNIASGTVADARLSANIALLNGSQTFTGSPLFKNTSNSTTAFQIQPSGSTTPVFDVDTTNSRVGIGIATPTRTLDVVGDQGGNVVNDTRATESSAQTYTESTKALAYYLSANSTTTDTTFDTTFNITGLSNTEGSYAYIFETAIKGTTAGARSHGVIVQINGAQISGICSNTGNPPCTTFQSTVGLTKRQNYIVMYVNGAWRIAGYGNTVGPGASTADTADLAEWIHYTGAQPVAGEVLTIGDESVSAKQSSTPYDSKLLGVVTTSPHTVMGADDGHSVAMALTGRVPVKISLENGPVERGDYLTSSSTPGYAMKATHSGQVVGQALEAFDGTGGGQTVMAMVKAQYQVISGNEANTLQGDQAISGSLNVSGDVDVAGNLTVHNLTTTKDLVVTGSAMVGTLNVTGSARFNGDITVGGHVITAGGQPTSQLQAAAGTPDPGHAAPTIAISGTDTLGTITITTSDNPTAGELAKILFSKSYGAAPKILLSPANANASRMQFFRGATSLTDFMLNFSSVPTANTTYQFDYFIGQ